MTILEEGYKSFRKEYRALDKLLSEIEKGNYESITEFEAFFLSAKLKTDSAIDTLLSTFSFPQLEEEMYNMFKRNAQDATETFLLASLIDSKINSRIHSSLSLEDRTSFREEHARYLFAIYMYYVKNSNMREQVKKDLHSFMLITLAESQFIRNNFSGNYEEAMKLSDPDNYFGPIKANLVAEKEYFDQLNKLINSTNGDEMFEGLINEDLVEAKKIKTQLDFAALCMKMEDRGIKYPVSIVQASDFTEDLMAKASSLVKEFKRDDASKNAARRIIRL